MKLPSLGDWLAQQDERTQYHMEAYIFMAPMLISEMLFIYLWVFMWLDFWQAIPLPTVLGSVMYVAINNWKTKLIEETGGLEGIVMNVRWQEGMTKEIRAVIEGYQNLLVNDHAALVPASGELLQFCPGCGSPMVKWEKGLPLYCGHCGAQAPKLDPKMLELRDYGKKWDYTRMKFTSPRTDPGGKLWSDNVFIHQGPKDLVFARQPGQTLSHKGMMLQISAANIDVIYLGFREEIEHQKFFLVRSDPEACRLIQLGLGITPEGPTTDMVANAGMLASIREAQPWMHRALEAESSNQVMWEQRQDVKILAEGNEADFRDNRETIEKGLNLRSKLSANWKSAVIGLALLGSVWWLGTGWGWW